MGDFTLSATSCRAGEPDLAKLDPLVVYEQVLPDYLNLPAADGFLAAIVVGPDRIPPEEWMSLLGHEGDPRWPGEYVARHLCTARQARHDRMLQQRTLSPSPSQPIFAIMDDGTVVATDWAGGFLLGLDLRPRRWAPLGKSEESRRFLVPIVCPLPDWDEPIQASPGGKDLLRFRSQAQLFIPYGLGEIRRFWTRRGGGSKRSGSGARWAGRAVKGGLSGRRW